jgi:HemY protein
MRRRQRRGLDALSGGMIAIGAGDRAGAARYALQARKSLPNEPLTHLLRAQAAQLSGDRATARRIFEAMLSSPDTEQLGLRGLFLEASREGEREVQQQFAARALRLNPRLPWPVEALFDLQCRDGHFDEALETLSLGRRYGHIQKAVAERRRAILLTAQAQALEEQNPGKALTLAMEAHNLADDLIPAAAIAGRLLAARGNTARVAKVIQRTWSKAPHPELATAYAYARVGDSPRDRLDRIKQLAALNPRSIEGPIATAVAAIEAKQYDDARHALSHLVEGRMPRRVALLMARIESEQYGDKGRVREWLARAAHAAPDPVWIADGVTSDHWAPVSPVTGALDAFQWRVPVEETNTVEALEVERFEALVALKGNEIEAVAVADNAGEGTAVADAETVETTVEAKEPAQDRRTPSPATTSSRPRKIVPKPDAAVSDVRPAEPASSQRRKAAQTEPQVFVAPPAPDDPGTEPEDAGETDLSTKPYRVGS